jgi:hypothetical protein
MITIAVFGTSGDSCCDRVYSVGMENTGNLEMPTYIRLDDPRALGKP